MGVVGDARRDGGDWERSGRRGVGASAFVNAFDAPPPPPYSPPPSYSMLHDGDEGAERRRREGGAAAREVEDGLTLGEALLMSAEPGVDTQVRRSTTTNNHVSCVSRVVARRVDARKGRIVATTVAIRLSSERSVTPRCSAAVAATARHATRPRVLPQDDVCDQLVTMGVDAEGPVVDAALLPRALGVTCRTWPFFRNDPRMEPIDRPAGDAAAPAVHIALNPGHYFLLYPGVGRG